MSDLRQLKNIIQSYEDIYSPDTNMRHQFDKLVQPGQMIHPSKD